MNESHELPDHRPEPAESDQVDLSDVFPTLPVFKTTMTDADKASILDRTIPDKRGRAFTPDGTIWQDGVPVADVDYLVERAFGPVDD